MFLAAAAALWLANSALAESYFRFWESTIDIRFGGFRFDHLSELTVRDWVNDGLMAVFFFVVSLEIKRELVVGRLNSLRESVLPIVAAIGGMLGPAAVYLVIARSAAPDGWAIPVATDIAFALGFLALAGPLVPLSAKLFLLTMAIADDLGAIALIAIFYTEDLALGWIGFAVVVFLAGLMMERSGIRSVVGYGLIGGLLWVAVLESGVHATVAGVALAVLTPVRSRFDPRHFGRRARTLIEEIDGVLPDRGDPAVQLDEDQAEHVQGLLFEMDRLSRGTLAPLHRFESLLGPIMAFAIVPTFAFANAGLRIPGSIDEVTLPVMWGVGLGLVLGKVAGIVAFTWLSVRMRVANLPAGMTWHHLVGLSLLAGVGFTVALFVTGLTFESATPEATAAKLGIFGASLLAGIAGVLWLRISSRRSNDPATNAQ